jgi:hypothetical protein
MTNCTRTGEVSEEQPFQLLVAGNRKCAIFVLDPDGFIRTWNAGANASRAMLPVKSSACTFRFFGSMTALPTAEQPVNTNGIDWRSQSERIFLCGPA